jgi:hypothetical protein
VEGAANIEPSGEIPKTKSQKFLLKEIPVSGVVQQRKREPQ